jgi:hypothetical protein
MRAELPKELAREKENVTLKKQAAEVAKLENDFLKFDAMLDCIERSEKQLPRTAQATGRAHAFGDHVFS